MSLIDYDCEFIIILIRVVFIFTAVLNFTVAVIGNKSHNLVLENLSSILPQD